MRFIIGFFFFGLLFYAIWFYSPETFQTLVSWAAKLFDLIREWIEKLVGKINSSSGGEKPVPQHVPQSLGLLLLF